MSGTTYWAAPDVEEMAQKLIEDNHAELIGIHIEYVFRSPAATKAGMVRLGQARKIGGLTVYLAHAESAFFVMEIAGDVWPQLSERKRKALVDHELCHMGVDDDGIPTVAGHDIEEFVAVVERHGIWRRELESFQLAAQMALPFDGDEGDDA